MNQSDDLSILQETTSTISLVDNISINNDFLDIHSEQNEQMENFPEAKQKPQYIAVIVATLSTLAAGAVLGWTSPILDCLNDGKYNNIPVNNNQLGWIGSFVTLGAMFICFPTGYLCNLLGVRMTLFLILTPFSFGWCLILLAENIITLYFGRFITGMAVGACCVATPLYINEIAQKEIRGSLGSYFQLMITSGIFLSYLFGQLLTPINYTSVCSLLPLLFGILFIFQPNSPMYYIKQGRYDKALISLKKLRGNSSNNDNELREIETSFKDSLNTRISFRESLMKRENYRALIISMALMFFQQFSGINAILLYISNIFVTSGMKINPNIGAIIVGSFQVIFTFISSLIIDKLGRRKLLLYSGIIMFLTTLLLALFFTLKYRFNNDFINYLNIIPIITLCLFIIVFSIGFGPIPWIITSEIFHPDIKNLFSSISITFNWFLAFIITKFYFEIKDLLGEDILFYLFSLSTLLGIIFVYFKLPETKGRTIEEIQILLIN